MNRLIALSLLALASYGQVVIARHRPPAFDPTTSYANTNGTGNRQTTISVGTNSNGVPNRIKFVNGNTAESDWFWNTNLGADKFIEFGFNAQYVVDEAKFYQSAATTHGTWKWQGSNNRSTWSDIGSSFTLGGSTTQTITALNGNTTPYRYYRMVTISGATSNSPWLREMEFKISAPATSIYTTLYSNSIGMYSRTGTITVTTSGLASGTLSGLVNGAFANDNSFIGSVGAGKYLQFDFGSGKVVDEATMFQTTTDSHGTFQWSGSNDGSSFTDIGSTFTLGGSLMNVLTELNGNSASYRYLRLTTVSGATNATPFIYEFEFRSN